MLSSRRDAARPIRCQVSRGNALVPALRNPAIGVCRRSAQGPHHGFCGANGAVAGGLPLRTPLQWHPWSTRSSTWQVWCGWGSILQWSPFESKDGNSPQQAPRDRSPFPHLRFHESLSGPRQLLEVQSGPMSRSRHNCAQVPQTRDCGLEVNPFASHFSKPLYMPCFLDCASAATAFPPHHIAGPHFGFERDRKSRIFPERLALDYFLPRRYHWFALHACAKPGHDFAVLQIDILWWWRKDFWGSRDTSAMKFISILFIWAFTFAILELQQIEARTSERDRKISTYQICLQQNIKTTAEFTLFLVVDHMSRYSIGGLVCSITGVFVELGNQQTMASSYFWCYFFMIDTSSC